MKSIGIIGNIVK